MIAANGMPANDGMLLWDGAAGADGGSGEGRGGLRIAFFGSSLVSAYWNGAATYYRGIIRALAERGHRVTFYEPDVLDRQKHRDIDDPEWCKVVVYPAQSPVQVLDAVESAAGADVVVKASGVGVFDALLEEAVVGLGERGTGNGNGDGVGGRFGDPLRAHGGSETRPTTGPITVFWDVDAPATLARVEGKERDPFRKLIPRFDAVLTYGGGPPVVRRYEALGASRCVPIYNALDPLTHHRTDPHPRFECELAFLGNRLPDREARVEEFFFTPARLLPEKRFVLGGSGWETKELPPNVRSLGHVYTKDHNALNSTPLAVLNVSRESMASTGYSPATRVFEAAGAGACIITDAWEGLELFLKPGAEVLTARNGAEVAELLRDLEAVRSRAVGERARRRVLLDHTYARRAAEVEDVLVALRGKAGIESTVSLE